MTKEILKDEQLTEEQLNEVAGGSWMESVSDCVQAFDRKIPGFNKIDPRSTEGAVYLLKNWTEGDNVVGQLKKMFAGYGIDMTYEGKPFDPNTYTYKGKTITQDEAWKIIDGK
ncbi:MAG: hypothetical protein IJS69_05460 [Selenomonadaceae bacterium]|nr:hypothetical protein [Selenomonadaceae bacterium]